MAADAILSLVFGREPIGSQALVARPALATEQPDVAAMPPVLPINRE